MQELVGRKLLLEEIRETQASYDFSKSVQQFPTMKELNDREIQCLRCRSVHQKMEVELRTKEYYCPTCIQLGRVTSKQSFYHLPEGKHVKREVLFDWQGTLTEGQKQVSEQLLKAVKQNSPQLVWAVTGAGKTEMLFEAIFYGLRQGFRIGLASPRVDVCLELFPRLQAVFPNERILLLHGKMTEPYKHSQLLICTTHQLLRFYRAFDVLIIDEVDSFPFVNNPALQQAVRYAVKEKSSLIYLTATPTKELTKQIQKRELPVTVLPARYHRRMLPVPKTRWCKRWIEKLNKQQCPATLLQLVYQLLKKNDILLFCPKIELMEKLRRSLLKEFPDLAIACVFAADEERLEKVLKMRQKEFRILITSTILERGVTFERVSVIVLGANHQVFSEASLVQIAGRVDRKSEYTSGEIWFLHDGLTKAIKSAIRQIKKMNHLAKERCLLDEMSLL